MNWLFFSIPYISLLYQRFASEGSHQYALLRLLVCIGRLCRSEQRRTSPATRPYTEMNTDENLYQCDSTLQDLGTTTTPPAEPWDLANAINSFTSAIANPTSYLKKWESEKLDIYSYDLGVMTASAASASSSLSNQLSTADAPGSTSIQSHINQIAANISRASSALQAAVSAINSPSTVTSTSTAGVGCAQTAAVGMGALVGAMAVLAHL